MCAGPHEDTTLPNVTFPSIQQVYGNVTFNATNPGVPPAPPSNTPGNDSSAQLPLFPLVQGVYSLVRDQLPIVSSVHADAASCRHGISDTRDEAS